MELHTIPIQLDFFTRRDATLVTWLGMAGALINARGTIIFIDALLSAQKEEGRLRSETGYYLTLPPPIAVSEVPRADLVMYTHADDDHIGRETAYQLSHHPGVRFLAPVPVLKRLEEEAVPVEQCLVARDWDTHAFGEAEITITPALHDWQDENPWQRNDCCGFLIKTQDGTIWHPGDTRLIDDLLMVKNVDVLFFDIAAITAHLGPEGSAQIARSSSAKTMIPYHYGTFDLPPGSFVSFDPRDSLPFVKDLPGEFRILQPGEVFKV